MALKRKSFDLTYKLNTVASAEKKSKEAAARQFGVDAKRIREWCSQKEKLVATKKKGKSKRRRLDGGGRKALDEDMEEDLFSWIVELRGRNLRVSRKMIRAEVLSRSANADFRASRGWLERFMKRTGLSLQRKTTVCQSTPTDSIPKLVSFIIHVRTLQVRHNYRHDCIFAMDETACWMDMPSDTTVHLKGASSVPVKSTGHEKNHFTLVLTAQADGTKSKPFVVFKGKGTRLIKDLQKIKGIVVRFSSNGWMNDLLTIDYLRSIIGQFSFNKRLLVWDAYKCHVSQAVRPETTRLRLHTAIIPGGCTKFIQATDVVWNASFKSHMRSHYDTWLAAPECHQYTKGGNMKSPSRSLLCEWVKSSWNAGSIELVKESFLSCAMTTSTDGSDDDKIHCLKPAQHCASGKSVLDEATRKLMAARDDVNDEDPFDYETDEDETENNEACIDEDDEEEDGDQELDSG